jgi:uncharacterized protein with PIN domain
MKFIADCMLGKLAKWLRMMGYDTAYLNRATDDELVRIAIREDRFLLTRDHFLAERRIVRSRCLFINSPKTHEQVNQVIHDLSLNPPNECFFTRCVLCNGEIYPVSKESVVDEVPPYVYKTQDTFSRCTTCGKVYWKGTHVEHVMSALGRTIS